MLPESLVSSYRKYKSDTDHIGNWLAKSTPAPTRLKGKARKAAKAAATPSTITPPTSTPPTSTPPKKKYVLAIKDFIPLAQHIASKAKGLIEKSSDFAATLDRAISLRKDHSKFYDENNQNGLFSATNKTHEYFIGILEGVRETLQPRLRYEEREQHTRDYGEAKMPNNPVELNNMFARLDVEEPSEDFLSAPTPSRAAESTSSPDADEYEVEQSLDIYEILLARHAFITDMNRFRSFIRETWILYKSGATTLEAAAITTNTTLDFARGLDEEYQKYCPTTAFELIKQFFVSQCILHGEDPNFRERPKDPVNFRMYDVADAGFLSVYILLDAYTAVMLPGTLPTYKPGFYGTYNPSSDRTKKSGREKWEEDRIILLEILSDFFVINRMPPLPAEDEITRSLRPFMSTKVITFSVLMAAQVFLDTHHVLRDHISRGYVDLGQTRSYIEASITHNLKFHETLRIVNWPKQNDMILKNLVQLQHDFVVVDFIADARRKFRDPFPTIPFNLLKQHPLFCGTLSFSFKVQFREAGITFVNAWGSVMYTAHLYNAARSEKLLHENRWVDMDLVELLHGSDNFFIGAPPKDVDAYFKHFCLSIGVSATNFAVNRRRTNASRVVASREGPRSLKQNQTVSQIFKDRFCMGGSGRFDMKTADIELILKKCGSDYFEEITNEARAAHAQDTPEMPTNDAPTAAGKKSRKQRTIMQQWQNTQTLTPMQLLFSLRSALQDEGAEMVFDYFRLHRTCWLLLRNLKEHLDAELKKIFGAGYLETESQLPYVVGYIFMAAVKQEAAVPGFLKKKRVDFVSNELLKRAADVLEGMLVSGAGGMVLKCMKDFMGVDAEIRYE
ncbi:hypothetical protein E2P81_ATG03852 [Venturia nashicola]|nr:hypothetical protein E2P81_ATG03852 [Venturia nashicola]